MILIVALKLDMAKSPQIKSLRRLTSSGYLLYSELQRTIILCALLLDKKTQESYFMFSMGAWVASLTFQDVKSCSSRRPSRIMRQSNRYTCVTLCFIFNALCFLSFISIVEFLFNRKMNKDSSLGLFFWLSVSMKVVRIFQDGKCL